MRQQIWSFISSQKCELKIVMSSIGNQRQQFCLVRTRKRRRRNRKNSGYPYRWQITTLPRLSCQGSLLTWFIKKYCFFPLNLALKPKLAVKRIPWLSRGFCHEETKGDKRYLIAPEVRYVTWPTGAGLRRIFCFSTNQTKVQILESKCIALFSSPKQKGKKDTWSQVKTARQLIPQRQYRGCDPFKQNFRKFGPKLNG